MLSIHCGWISEIDGFHEKETDDEKDSFDCSV